MTNPTWYKVTESLPTEEDANELGQVYVAWKETEHSFDLGIETRHWASVEEDSVLSEDPELVNWITHWAHWELPDHPGQG